MLTTIKASMMNGSAAQMSTIRMIISSVCRPKYPANNPHVVPTVTPTVMEITTTKAEMRAPWITRLSKSRPMKSLPRT